MYQTISNVEKAIPLQQSIDNEKGNLRVGLKSITFVVGWYNLKAGESMQIRSGGVVNTIDVSSGLYTLDSLKKIMTSRGGVSLDVKKENGFASLTIDRGTEIMLTDGILNLLGLDYGSDGGGLSGTWMSTGIYDGDRVVNFHYTKSLHVFLNQINTSGNVVDGAPSTLLKTIGIGKHNFGDIKTFDIQNPDLKQLQHGTVTELTISVKDDNGYVLNNHNLPISVVLIII